jgi:hypothetical protein
MPDISVTMSITNPTEGSAWSGTATVNGDDNVRGDNANIGWSFDSGSITFTTVKQVQFEGSSLYYSTFRTQNTTDQFPQPQTGFSIDIWSELLHAEFTTSGSQSWDTFASGGNSWSLNSDKYSLIYDYSKLYAPYWSKGGTVTFTKN